MGSAPTYYNEFDPFAAQWLRNLADAGEVPAGVVDDRSIKEVTPADLAGYADCHFFAGIGGWPHALRLAGWPDGLGVWTGSCPCQGLSIAGLRGGADDARHLWPTWYELICECLPPVIFGEQSASDLGRAWYAAVRADLEALGYSVGCADLCAAGVSAPHARQRLFWGAVRASWNGVSPGAPNSYGGRSQGRPRGGSAKARRLQLQSAGYGKARGTPNPDRQRRQGLGLLLREGEAERRAAQVHEGARRGKALRLGDGHGERAGQDGGAVHGAQAPRAGEGLVAWRVADSAIPAGAVGGPWADAEWWLCRPESPGKRPSVRPAQPGSFPMAPRLPTHVGLISAYGNSIVPQVGAAFVRAFMEAAHV